MQDLGDTIIAVSSPAGGVRSILRVTGPQALAVCERVFEPSPQQRRAALKTETASRRLLPGSVRITDDLAVDAWLYLFFAPHSYTGEDLAEIHVQVSGAIVEALFSRLLAEGLRAAGPGEFTARAYLNGKLDLAQAEAVNEVISSSNDLQLEAAERLLSGRLTKAAQQIRCALLDILSLIEAGLDFSGEDIEFISAEETTKRLAGSRRDLEELLAGSIRYETLMDLPAVGIAGAPNAGKSSLLNALLGWERSIVSPQAKTTRDILTGVLTWEGRSNPSGLQPPASSPSLQCVLFDCAGLIPSPDNVLDELAQRAAIEALQRCTAVLFCVDSVKADWSEDIAVRALIRPKHLIHVATKSDLSAAEELPGRLQHMTAAFGAGFVPVSATKRAGLEELVQAIESAVRSVPVRAYRSTGILPVGSVGVPPTDSSNIHGQDARGTHGRDAHATNTPAGVTTDQGQNSHPGLVEAGASAVALTARHRQAVTEAMENVRQAIAEVERGNEEVAVMMIRTACQAIAGIEQEHLDEQVLDRIFSRFCIGK